MPLQNKYINPLTDFGFKRLFGTEANKDLVIDFLNQILPEQHQIKDLEYSDKDHQGETIDGRNAVFDIFCRSKNDEHFIVELQREKQEFFKDRSIFYSTHVIQAQAEKGREWNFKLPVVYTIAILDFKFEDYLEDNNLIHHIQLKDRNGKVFYDKMNYIYIELPKFTKKESELETHFEKWLFVFKWLGNLGKRPKELQERVFQKLFKIAEIAKFNKMERLEYERSLKQYRDYHNTIDYAKKYAAEEGMKEGIEKAELAKNLDIIKIGLAEGMTFKLMSKLTGWTVKKIKEVIKEKGW